MTMQLYYDMANQMWYCHQHSICIGEEWVILWTDQKVILYIILMCELKGIYGIYFGEIDHVYWWRSFYLTYTFYVGV